MVSGRAGLQIPGVKSRREDMSSEGPGPGEKVPGGTRGVARMRSDDGAIYAGALQEKGHPLDGLVEKTNKGTVYRAAGE